MVAPGILTARQAARHLGVTASQIRRWAQAGMPVVRADRPMLIDIEAAQAWRQGRHADTLGALSESLLQTLRCEVDHGKAAPALLGIDERRAAVLLLAAFDRACIALTGEQASFPWPVHIAALRRIAGAND